MKTRQLVFLTEIQRHPLDFCSSRQMDVIVETANGTRIIVPWANVPHMGTIPHKPTIFFDYFWYPHCIPTNAKIYLVHGDDENSNYLELELP